MQNNISTVSDLIAFNLPMSPNFPRSTSQTTAAWSALRFPPRDESISYSLPEVHDGEIFEEIMRQGRQKLAQLNRLDAQLPPSILSTLNQYIRSHSRKIVSAETDIDAMMNDLNTLVLLPMMEWLTDGQYTTLAQHPGLRFSQQGDFHFVRVPVQEEARPSADPTILGGSAIEDKLPLVALVHAEELHSPHHFTRRHLQPEAESGGRGMIVKIFLHISALDKEPHVGVFFDGWTVVLCQKICLSNGQWALVISKGRPTTVDQTLPDPDNVRVTPQQIDHWQQNTDPIPLIGLFLCLLLLESPLAAPTIPESLLVKARSSPFNDSIEIHDSNGIRKRVTRSAALKNQKQIDSSTQTIDLDIPMEVILHVHTGPTISPSNSSHSATTDDSLSSVSTPPTSPLEEPNSNVTKSYPISVPLPAAPPRLEASTVILIGKESTVWSGLLRGKEVILKAYELNKHAQQSLASEAACYERLSPLGLTPRFLGVYRGQVDSVLLVEHGGKSLTNWSELDDDEKQAFYTLVRAVHNAGVCHNDITPSNVVRGPQGVRLIDFGESHVGHSCEGTCSELRRLEQVLRTVNV